MAKNQRLNASITIGSVLDRSVRNNIGFITSGLGAVGDEIKKVESRQRELGRQRRVLEKQGRSVDALDREYEALNRTLVQLRRSQERWNRAASASRRVGSTFGTMASDIGRASRAVAVGAGLAGTAIFGLASSTAQLGDDVAKTADKLDIEIGALQELRFVAERSGVTVGEFDKSLEKMLKNLGEASTGTGTAVDALEQLGLKAEDLIVLEPDVALGLIADRMNEVGTQAERASIASDIFGRSGISMLNIVREGSEGIADLRDQARQTGYVLSNQAARDAEVFQDVLLDTTLIMKGLKNTVGAELLPVITGAMVKVGESLVSNRDDVEEWATTFAEGVGDVLPVIGELATGLGHIASITAGVVTQTAEMVGGWENFGIIVGTVLASKTLVSVGKFAAAVWSLGSALVAIAAAANPIGLAVTAIVAGGALIYAKWGKIGPWLSGVWTGLGDVVSATWDRIEPVFDAMTNTQGITRAWESVKTTLEPVLTWIGDAFEKVMEFIAPVVGALQWTIDKGGQAVSALGLGGGSVMDNHSGGSGSPSGPSTGLDRLRNSISPSVGSAGGVGSPQAATGADGPSVVQNVTNNYNASGLSADELLSAAERRDRLNAGSGLFDQYPLTGR